MEDRSFKLAVGGGAAALVVAIVLLRFCGTLSVPAAPEPPAAPASTRSARDILTASSETAAAWQAFIEKDAKHAGIQVPTPEAMSKTLPYQLDDHKLTVVPGDPPLERAGLRITAEVAEDDGESDLVLVIENTTGADLAYHVVTRPSGNAAACHARQILFYDANVVAAHRSVRRSECVYHVGQKLAIDRIETVELTALSSVYVSRLPAGILTTDTRLTAGHKPLGTMTPCNVMMSQVIRSGLDSGKIEWRDLVDFYARHRCDTYPFPEGYKAFKKDGERPLPVVSTPR
jgi:hypothetical protein